MICQEKKMDCFAFGPYGRCKALTDTSFDHECPFYKTSIQVRKEHNANLDRLERLGRFDLLDKYTNQDKRNSNPLKKTYNGQI